MLKVVSIGKSADTSALLAFDEALKYLSEKKLIEYKCIGRLGINASILNWGDYFFFCRSGYKSDSYLMKSLKKAGKCAVYVLDDDLLNIPEGLNVPRAMKSKEYSKGIKKNIECCEIFASPSRVLIEKYGKDKESILLEEAIVKKREFCKHLGYPVKIGFAGTLSRTEDVNRILSEVLIKIKDKYKEKVSIEFMGAKPDFLDKVNGKYYPFVDNYEEYADTLYSHGWDIGLAPLPDTSFHNCKHYIKFIEYSSMGIVSIMSDVVPYTRLRDDEMPAIFCKNTFDGWFNVIASLVEDYSRLQENRYEVFLKGNATYSLEICANRLWKKLNEYEENRKVKRTTASFWGGGYFISLFFSYMKINGVASIIKKVHK